jgi:transcription elongation factor GreB
MSKAFTRESDEGTQEPVGAVRESVLPPGATNYMTPAGARRVREELEQLGQVARPAALRALAASEAEPAQSNAEAAARRRLQEIDRRIRVLSEHLESAEVVDPAAQDQGRALFGATVTVRDEDEREQSWRIVGIDEADAKQGRVSWLSPLAQALLGARVGDVVTFRSPKGEEELEIVRIAYERDS